MNIKRIFFVKLLVFQDKKKSLSVSCEENRKEIVYTETEALLSISGSTIRRLVIVICVFCTPAVHSCTVLNA